MRNKGADSALGPAFHIERRVGEIAKNRAGGGVLTRAATIIEGIADDIAPDKNGIENVIHAGQDVIVRDQRRIDRNLHGRAAAVALAFRLGLLHDAEQFYGIAELASQFKVQRCDRTDALDIDVLRVHPEAMRERGKDSYLVHGIDAIDVERWFGFGVSEALRIREHVAEF